MKTRDENDAARRDFERAVYEQYYDKGDYPEDEQIAVLKSVGVGDPAYGYYIWEQDNIKSLLEAIGMDLEFLDEQENKTITITISREFMTRKELDELPEN